MKRTVSWLLGIWLLVAACSASAAEPPLPARMVERPPQEGVPLFSCPLRDLYQDSDATALLYETGGFELYTKRGVSFQTLPNLMSGIVARTGGQKPVFLVGSPLGPQLQFVPKEGVKSLSSPLYKLVKYARGLPGLEKNIAYICANRQQDRLAFLTYSEEAAPSAAREKTLHCCYLNKKGDPLSYAYSFPDDEEVSYQKDLHHLCLRMDFLEDDSLVFLSKDSKQERLLVLRESLPPGRGWTYELPTPFLGFEKAGGGKVRILRRRSSQIYECDVCIEELDSNKPPFAAILYSKEASGSFPITPACLLLASLGEGWWAYPQIKSGMYLHLWCPDTGMSVALLRAPYPWERISDYMRRWWRVVGGTRLCYYLPVNHRKVAVGSLPVGKGTSYAWPKLTGCIKGAFPAQWIDGTGVFSFINSTTARFYRFCEQDGLPDIKKSEDIRLGFEVYEHGFSNAAFVEYRGAADKTLRCLALQRVGLHRATGRIEITLKIYDLSGGRVSEPKTSIPMEGVFLSEARPCQMRWHTPQYAPPILVLLLQNGTLQAWSVSGEPIPWSLLPPAKNSKPVEEMSLSPDFCNAPGDEAPFLPPSDGKFCYLEATRDLLLYKASHPRGAPSPGAYHLYTYFYDTSQTHLALQYVGPLPLAERHRYQKDIITTITSYQAGGRKSIVTVVEDDGSSTKIWESCLPASPEAASLAAAPEERIVCNCPLPHKLRLYRFSYGFIVFDRAGSSSRLIPVSYLAASGYARQCASQDTHTRSLPLPTDIVYLISRFVGCRGGLKCEPTDSRDAVLEWSTINGQPGNPLQPLFRIEQNAGATSSCFS